MTAHSEPLPDSLDLVRDVLDEQVIDRRGRAMGKVDSVLLELRPGAPPRVTLVEIGLVAAARRLHPALGNAVRNVMSRLGVGNGEVLRLPVTAFRKRGVDLQVDIDAEDTPAYAWERWLRGFIGHIPGAGKR